MDILKCLISSKVSKNTSHLFIFNLQFCADISATVFFIYSILFDDSYHVVFSAWPLLLASLFS